MAWLGTDIEFSLSGKRTGIRWINWNVLEQRFRGKVTVPEKAVVV